jgi:hypothetical protein
LQSREFFVLIQLIHLGSVSMEISDNARVKEPAGIRAFLLTGALSRIISIVRFFNL